MSLSRALRVLVWLILAETSVSHSLAQGQPPSGVGDVRLDGEKITNTPVIEALCISGTGDARAYADAVSKLIAYTNANSIQATGTAFSDTWTPGADPKDPSNGSSWDICIEATGGVGTISPPFAFRTLDPKKAVYAECTASAEYLNKCFSLMEASALNNKYYPAMPPRFKVGATAPSSKHVYMIWLPVIPMLEENKQ